MIGTRYDKPYFHSVFYRNCFRSTLVALFVSIVVMCLLIVAIIYLVLFKPQTHYYAMTQYGKIIPLHVER